MAALIMAGAPSTFTLSRPRPGAGERYSVALTPQAIRWLEDMREIAEDLGAREMTFENDETIWRDEHGDPVELEDDSEVHISHAGTVWWTALATDERGETRELRTETYRITDLRRQCIAEAA